MNTLTLPVDSVIAINNELQKFIHSSDVEGIRKIISKNEKHILFNANIGLLTRIKDNLLQAGVKVSDPLIQTITEAVGFACLCKEERNRIMRKAVKASSKKGVEEVLLTPYLCVEYLACEPDLAKEQVIELAVRAGSELTELNLRGFALTDDELESLFHACPRLEKLELLNTKKLTSKGFTLVDAFKTKGRK